MPVTVGANGMSVVHQGSGGVTQAFPDVCKTPAPPAPPIPIPYPNIAQSSDTASGTKKVKAEGKPICINSSNFSTSTGDEAGTLKGLVSMKTKLPRCCPSVLGTRLKRDDAEELASAFKAIADPGRLRLLSFIAAQPGAEACVCNLIEPLGLAQPTVSHHLKVLAEAGLLVRERRATWMFYRLVPERVRALQEALALPVDKPATKRSA